MKILAQIVIADISFIYFIYFLNFNEKVSVSYLLYFIADIFDVILLQDGLRVYCFGC